MKLPISLLLFVALGTGCSTDNYAKIESSPSNAANEASTLITDLIDYVDPMIGTDGIGHTFPGATVPFGMVQLSPSNDFKAWNWCSGYHYSDTVIKGFAHTHISGAGLAGLGDILVMPTVGTPNTAPGTEEDPATGYRSRFSHDHEVAKPGYYQVLLQDYEIDAELTTTERVGVHRYTFTNEGEANIIIDPAHHIIEVVSETHIDIIDSQSVRGYKITNGEAGPRTAYFYATFSKPFKQAIVTENNEALTDTRVKTGEQIKAALVFNTEADEQIEVKVALSHVSLEGAYQNYLTEAKDSDFDAVYAQARAKWSEKLNRIAVEMQSEDDLRTFATAMYHSFIHPNIISDVDGKYFVNEKVFHTDYPQYSNYSTWDTYRALHPLYTIIEQDMNAKFINSLISRKTVSNIDLPVWEALGHDNVCMIGYNAVPVIADAIIKESPNINVKDALATIKAAAFDNTRHSPHYDLNGVDDYQRFHYVPGEIGTSVSKTTEYNYFDWTIAQVAQKLGAEEDAALFTQRSLGYRNLFDKNSGYLIPETSDGKKVNISQKVWDDLTGNYISGNVWGYSTYVPQDIAGLISLHGGSENFSNFLDAIFSDNSEIGGSQHVDISGFIGKYGHGDEPSQHMPYLYTFAGKPWRTQEIVRDIMKTFYTHKPDGLINNDDLGQMSAWYIFSALGFYPVTPGEATYILGSPVVKQAAINLENGKRFTISTENQSEQHIYVKAILLNGEAIHRNYITHQEIMAGGTLHYVMSSEPTKTLDENYELAQSQPIANNTQLAPVVLYTPDIRVDQFFADTTEVSMSSINTDAQILYTLDGSEPTAASTLYKGPFTLRDSSIIRAKAFKTDYSPSKTAQREVFRSLLPALEVGKLSISLANPAYKYGDPSGKQLADGIVGGRHFSDGAWTGFSPDDMEAVFDLGDEHTLSTVRMQFLTDTKVWIFPPSRVQLSLSNDGKNWTDAGLISKPRLEDHTKEVSSYVFALNSRKARFIKVVAENYGPMPAWHGAAGDRPFFFIDEVIFN